MLREPPLEVGLRPVLVLDIDGVLNGHERHGNGYCGTRKDCVTRLNRIIASTDCLLVVSSAWRYLVLNGHMTVVGLENLFLTHGIDCKERVLGVVRADPDPDTTDRGVQIGEFCRRALDSNPVVVVDDLDLGHSAADIPFVQTDRFSGLTDADAERIVGILGRTNRVHHQEAKLRQWRRK